ncbi:cytoplasmic dynein 2 heavy chain 1 [Battus philenor]|uniref:cytoplasmic dynein 2 heavy chain 1 n=1 Tax=Battus philenor TaxID=42288 RepID=UPI0035CF9EC6
MSKIRDFILNTAESFFNVPRLKLADENALFDFISNAQTYLLRTTIHEKTLFFSTEIKCDTQKAVVFYKNSPIDLSSEDCVNNLNIITITAEAAESLYQIMRQIFNPLLSLGDDLFTNKLQNNLVDLETNLRILTHGKSNGNINVILSIEDEVNYWKAIGEKRDVSKKEREAACNFCVLFEDIWEEIKSMQACSVYELRDSAENIGGILDDIWRYVELPYSQDRMIHILDITGHIICSLTRKSLSSVDLWKVHNGVEDNELLRLITECLNVTQTWIDACASLTETYWPNYALHPWNGKGYIPQFCLNFHQRVKEINDLRSIHNQLNKLLTNNEKAELKTDELFEPFASINIWICNSQNSAWENAVLKFSSNLRPCEANIAKKLKPRLHNISTKQMLYEFMRYKSLINRPIVKQALSNELEMFLSSLLAMLKNIREQLNSDEVHVKMYQPPEMSPLVQQIQWAKQMEAKTKDIQMSAENYLKEFQGSAEVSHLARQVLKDLKNFYTQLHEEWARDLQAQVKSGSLQLSIDKPVVEFSAQSRLMVVNYNPRLVWTELEARALAALDLPAPNAAQAIDTLTTSLRYARALQQVASFHNTLGERMIPSTRPMMLQAALDMSALVQEQKAVYWNDIEQLSKYTDQLKKMVLKLETQNAYLTSQHIAIRNVVEKLMDTELLVKQAEWKKNIKEIRDIIEKVEANGYKNTEQWRLHWDWQLYKALEYQYIKTLLSLHTHFPPARVDLVLRARMVRSQPPLEEVRVQHYHQLRRLVSLPAQFVGLSGTITSKQSIFSSIVNKHSWLGNKAVHQLETTLASLANACDDWTRRLALACVPDLDALCNETLQEPIDWENNFKACKAYGQAIAKMSFEDEKIAWISVGTATLRREFEAQTRNLWACLMSSLQASCRSDSALLNTFVANAVLMLDNKALPKNAKELAEISMKQQVLQEKLPEMEKLVENMKRKGHMLRTWGGDPIIDNTIKEWLKVREQMLAQQQMFQHQAEIVKSSLKGEWENLNMNVEIWLSRWVQAKSRLDNTQGADYEEMVERCRSIFEAHGQWEKYCIDRNELQNEFEKFNIQFDIPETWKEADKLIKEYVEQWTIMKDYHDEYESITEQDWIVFQKKLHLLDEFTLKWGSQIEPYTTITLYLKQQIEKYSDLTIALKYLRGADFTERHWSEVFSLLDIEYKPPESLKLKDLLAAANNIKKQVKALQKICISASNESAVRSAVSELELWYAGARLAILYHNDKAKRPVPIVKDFKEILNKIEEKQWVVSSVGGGSDTCSRWETRLKAARQLLRAAHRAQRRWLYLEPILCNDDGELGSKFRKVDQGFRQVARILESDPRISALMQSARLQPTLDAITEQLNSCQSALNQYIDEKRSIFPRLYFLSDDDLLELLGQARDGAEGREAVMQSHLKKLFPGITSVKLGPSGLSITALCSHYGEIFHLDHPVDIDCPVEVWLKNLEKEIRSTLRNLVLNCMVNSSSQMQDPFSLPTQILCLAQNIRFTEQAEKAIASKELHKLMANVEKENSYYAAAEVEDECEKQKRQALILQCAHYTTVVRTLIDHNITSTDDWLWQKQLRFYLLKTKEIEAQMGLAKISYSYEYLGVNTGQFVRTKLADECFLILTQSLHLGSVGNPFGPAGTGKTESVKALGGLVGRLVLVFNCDEAMDGECMGRLLTGLALSGAWGCFDEFNRLSSATLATVSHQFTSLLAAMRSNAGSKAEALLNGKHVTVSEWCGVAATMNPCSRGYGGRRALPAALCRVLRPVSMSQPRGDELARQLFTAHCLAEPHARADDLYTVFTMASMLLSGQRHYDWGLRALKAAVGSCGIALSTHADASEQQQRMLLRRVLRLNNLSKLTKHDARRFESILSIVFSGIPEEETTVDPIFTAIESSVQDLELVYKKDQVQKCMELYEQLQQRMGVAIVGPPGTGKSTIRRLLKTALLKQGKNVVEYVIYPKAMSRSCLLGNIDHDTRQWTDGVISTVALEVSNQPQDVWSWVICDGDIDPEWIEALNSVLDDNRLLTLPSGWRVQFGQNVNFVFETHSLEHASPATVSRLGIILLSDEDNCAEEVLECWTRKTELESELGKLSKPILYQTIKKCIEWFDRHKSDVTLKLYNSTMVKQILTQFEHIIENNVTNSVHMSPEELVYLAVQRSIIGIIKETALDDFHTEMSRLLGPPVSDRPQSGEWVADSLYFSPRLSQCEPSLRANVTAQHSHALLIGPQACAKNILAEYVSKESNSTVITIDCTPILEPADIIAELKRSNAVRSGGQGGDGQSRVMLLVRGLHRARRDQWGSCALHAFLLQLMQQGGFWSQEDGGVQWCHTARPRVLATANSMATAASTLPPRLIAELSPLMITDPDDEELTELAKKCLMEQVSKIVSEQEISEIISNMLSMFKEISENFASRPHYKWNASHLRKWCAGIGWHAVTSLAEFHTAIRAEADLLFKNRLVSDEEIAEYYTIVRRHLKQCDKDTLYFKARVRNDGVYLEAVDYNLWYQDTQKLINKCLTESDVNIFTETGIEACSELAALCLAIIRAINGGVSLCVSSTGAGRRASTALVSASLPASLFSVQHHNQFSAMFKNALSSAGECTRTLIVLEESAVDDNTLACIEALRKANTLHAVPTSILPSSSSSITLQHQLQNIKQNLGIVILLNKDQENLSDLIEKYPLLHSDSDIVWLERWSEETLRLMPTLIVQRLLKEDVSDVTKEDLDTVPVEGFVNIYKSIDVEWLRAPCRYVNFIKSYYFILSKKKSELQQRKNILSSGIEALRRARAEVAVLQKEAAVQEVALSEKQTAANSALDQIGATVRSTTDKKDEMHALKKNIEIENEKLQIRKKEIEAELASVEPVIKAARAAVGDIRPESLSEVRSLRAPPDVVRDVLEGVLRLMGIADTSWHSMKSFLSKRGVKEDIRCLDASQISSEAVQSVRKLLERRGSSFEQAVARRASAACAPLAAWVRANLEYADALARVTPLQKQQRELHRNLQEAEAELAALSNGLSTVEERVAALKTQLGQHSRDAAALELKLTDAKKTLEAAQKLLDQLADEYDAWELDLQHISKEMLEVNIRSLLAAAYIVYLPHLTEPQAQNYVKQWSTLLGFGDESFSVINFLASSEKQLKWESEGLPMDRTAIKNAVLIDQALEIKKCGFTPLIFDPDGEAETWLRNTLADAQCEFVSQHSEKLATAMQYAVRLNRILVITEVVVGELPRVPAGCRWVLVSRSAQALGTPPATLSLLRCAASLHGLTDQLVHYALQQQNPEVNEKSKEIKIKKATLQKQQHELQENLLRELSKNGDILHDANLLASLNNTRATANTIREALDAAKALEAETNEAYKIYEPIASRAARLALAVKELVVQRPLVALPVDTIQRVFVDSFRKVGDLNKVNYDKIMQHLTRRIVERVLLSLHKRDKYIVILHLLKQVYDEIIPDNLWNIFIGNFSVLEDQNTVNDIRHNYPWVHEDRLKKVAQLKVNNEELFMKMSLDKEAVWKEFLRSGDLYALNKLQLDPFETVAAVSVVRPDTLYRAIVAFVDLLLGGGLMSGSEVVPAAARWATRRPVLLLAAHAADVLAAHAHALTMVGVEEGPGSWSSALESCSTSGAWLAIVVAASPFTRDLYNFLSNYANRPVEEFNSDFRLWVVAEDREIPSYIANLCMTVILEPPEGVKHNAAGTVSAWGRYEADAALVRVHACLALFHALAQERRAYIPHGWSRWYAWDWGDVQACATAARSVTSARAMQTSRALCGALYGARVAQRADAAVLDALLRVCLQQRALAHDWRLHSVEHPLPYSTQLQAYIPAFEAWPSLDSPKLLGLPTNCRVAWENNAANLIITGLREFTITINVKKNDGVTSLKFLLALWKKLMSGNPLVKADYHIEKEAGGWWGCVCDGEALESATAVRCVHAHLAACARAQAHAHAQTHTLHTVPEEWQLQWPGPSAPDEYLKELSVRAHAAVQRTRDRTSGSMPTAVDLRTFIRPHRVLWALRARTAERLACSVEQLALTSHWDCNQNDSSDVPWLVVTGLRLSGCMWASALTPTTPLAPSHQPAPPLLLRYVPSSETSITSTRTLDVPVYNNELREDILFHVKAPLGMEYDKDTAILNAVALFIASVD